jgi:hypothetical protein
MHQKQVFNNQKHIINQPLNIIKQSINNKTTNHVTNLYSKKIENTC